MAKSLFIFIVGIITLACLVGSCDGIGKKISGIKDEGHFFRCVVTKVNTEELKYFPHFFLFFGHLYYNLEDSCQVNIEVYNEDSTLIKTLVDRKDGFGLHKIRVNFWGLERTKKVSTLIIRSRLGKDIYSVEVTPYYLYYPNPFGPTSKCCFSLRDSGNVELVIYNLEGKVIRTLLDQKGKAGRYRIEWDGRDDQGNEVKVKEAIYKLVVDGKEIESGFLNIY